MKNKLLLLLLIVSLIGCKEKNQFRPVNLKCEGTTNPINIARTNPLFSWQFNDSSKGFMQSAYIILVASEIKLLNEKEADLWNSGKVASNQSNYIEYMGKAFKPSTRYYWTVKTWSNKNKESVFAEPASFETGILEVENWKASWVKPSKSLNETSSVLFRKEFNVKSKIKEARIYATALGAYELYLNGKKIGNQYLAPGWSNFLKRIQYQVFDITSELKEGKNAVGFLTGKFWNSAKDAASPFNHGIIMQLKVVYDDNTIEWFNSGNGWKVAQSPVTNCGFDSGEKYDSRLEKEGWSTAGYNESNWLNATYEKNNLNLVCQQIQPIIVHKELKPEKTVSSNKNSIVFDFGETLPGGEIKNQG
jgi:alpha-L-rhamnosidase